MPSRFSLMPGWIPTLERKLEAAAESAHKVRRDEGGRPAREGAGGLDVDSACRLLSSPVILTPPCLLLIPLHTRAGLPLLLLCRAHQRRTARPHNP